MANIEVRKLHYSISEVARLTGVEAHVLRFWEGEFPRLKPAKNSSGRRIYSLADIELIRHIAYLLREKRYTIEGARAELEGESQPVAVPSAQRADLLALRAFLIQLRTQLDE